MPYTRPTTLPEFCRNPPIPASDYIEPPNGIKDSGWVFAEKPPRQYFNWLHRLTYQWLGWFSELITYFVNMGVGYLTMKPTVPGSLLFIQGADSDSARDGAPVYIKGGSGIGTKNGGNVILSGGTSGTGTPGIVELAGLISLPNIGCISHDASAHAISGTGWRQCNFNNDILSNGCVVADSANNRLQLTSPGKYLVIANRSFESTDSSDYNIFMKISGSDLSTIDFFRSSGLIVQGKYVHLSVCSIYDVLSPANLNMYIMRTSLDSIAVNALYGTIFAIRLSA